MRTSRCVAVVFIAFFALTVGKQLRADPILTQIVSASFVAVEGAIPIGIQPFDPALGTLLSVNVTINGQLGGIITGSLSPSVSQEFFGVGTQFFDFDGIAIFHLPGAPIDPQTFLPIPTPFARSFSYTFTFDQTTDLLGFVFPSTTGVDVPPTSISGLTSSFVEPAVPINEIGAIHALTEVENLQAPGSLIFQYNYTPIPEPGTLLLLGSGLAGLAGFGRKRLFRQTRDSQG